MTDRHRVEMIARFLSHLFEPGDLVEIRGLNTSRGTCSGLFDDSRVAAKAALHMESLGGQVYYLINPVSRASAISSRVIKLRNKRMTDKLERRKIPETLKHTREAKLAELMDDALANSIEHNGRSAQSNLRGVIAALTPDLGEREASSITIEELTLWLRRRGKAQKWADGTYNNYVTQLKVMYRLGMQHKKASVNPATELKRRALNNDKPRYLTTDEEKRMDKALEQWPEHVGVYLFAKHTGLRAGAQFHLRWSQVDLDQRTITLPAKINSKYRKHRILPLNDVAYRVLLDRWARKVSSLIFNEYHRKTYLTKPANWFPKIVEAAGIEDFTWHSMRHDFASQLVMRGADLKTIQMLMGHANIKQTAMYAELSPEHLRSAVETLMVQRPTAIRTATALED